MLDELGGGELNRLAGFQSPMMLFRSIEYLLPPPPPPPTLPTLNDGIGPKSGIATFAAGP
jgi:hypothetical protein